MDHILNFKNISAAYISNWSYYDLQEFFDGMLDHVKGFKSGLAFVLLTHVK